MATSGTINGTISGTRPYLRLNWSRTETDVGGNRSKLRLQLYLIHPYTVRYSATKSGVLQGSSFNSTTNVSGTGSTLLRTQDIWVGHNADGSKTQSLSASFNINITYSGSWLGQLTVSGNANITAIPRASTLSAFSFGGHLKNGVANSIKYTVDRKSGSFRHQIQLRDGSTTIWTWDNQNTDGSNSIPLTASNVNTLLNRIKTSTTKSFTLRVATRSGNNGGWIGSAVSRNATATVHADVKPTVGAVSLSQTGNSVSSHYLQGKSKVNAKFTRSAGYGASITSSSIQVRRVSGGADSQTINSNDGTTNNPVTLNGSYQARGTATDSRGRTTNTEWATFTVTAYSAPRITNFTAVRSSSAETTVSISRAGTHTHLGGSNVLTYTVQRRIGTGSWTNVNTNATGTSTTASFSGTSTSTGNSVTSSYDFRIVITDKFGESATATVIVSTQRVVLDIHKNEGVGIGKIHEQGVLDVEGSAYFSGGITVSGPIYMEGGIQSKFIPSNTNLNIIHQPGFYYNSSDAQVATMSNVPSKTAFSLLVERHAGVKQTFTRYNPHTPQTWVRNYYNGTWGDWSISYMENGQNNNGDWYRFSNGLQICITVFNNNFSTDITAYVDLPKEFSNNYFSGFVGSSNNYWLPAEQASALGHAPYSSTMSRVQRYNASAHTRGDDIASYRLITIGRWK